MNEERTDPGPGDAGTGSSIPDASDRTTAVLPPRGTTPPPGVPPTPPTGPTAPASAGWTPPPTPDHGRSVLTRVTVGLTLLTAGVLWALVVADAVTLNVGQILSAALLVVALGLLVGSFAGRGRGLIGLGFVLLPLVVLAQIVTPFPLGADDARGQAVGDLVESPTDLETLAPRYQLAAGSLVLDLSELEFADDTRIEAQVGLGELTVTVPADVEVVVTGRVGAGDLELLDRRSDGVGLAREVRDEGRPGAPALELDLNVGLGELTVTRALDPDDA